MPVFFYVVNVGALGSVAEQSGAVGDFKAFQLPVAIIFAVTGISQANALVTDIQDGYFDRLLLTPDPAAGAAARPDGGRPRARDGR